MAYYQQQAGGFQPQQVNPGQGYYQYQQSSYPAPPPNQAGPVYGAGANIEGGVPKREIGFSNRAIRAAFVRKVFFLVSIMLAVVTAMTAIPFLHSGTMEFVKRSPGFYFVGYFLFLIVYIALMCCESVRRSFPVNLICTGILTISIGYMTMMISAFHSVEIVLMCLIITTVCCSCIILFSMQTKYDLTNLVGILAICGLVLMIYGLVAITVTIFFPNVRFLYTIYAGLAALLFMFYLAVDIQMIMGGRKFELSPEEYIFAAIQIFLDIVYIFWMLLMIFGDRSN